MPVFSPGFVKRILEFSISILQPTPCHLIQYKTLNTHIYKEMRDLWIASIKDGKQWHLRQYASLSLFINYCNVIIWFTFTSKLFEKICLAEVGYHSERFSDFWQSHYDWWTKKKYFKIKIFNWNCCHCVPTTKLSIIFIKNQIQTLTYFFRFSRQRFLTNG